MNMFSKVFGTRSQREVKRIMPLVEKIESLRPDMQKLSDEELKGKTMETDLSFKDGKLDYKAKAVPDTVYVPGKDSIIYVPQEVKVEVEVNRLTWWQETWMRIGKISISILALLLGLKGVRKLLKRN